MARAKQTKVGEPTIGPRPEQSPYRPFGAALELMLYRDPDEITEVILSGPAGTGKSRATLEKMHLCALKYPGMRGLIVRKTRSSLTQTGLVTFEEKVLPRDSPIKAGPDKKQRQSYKYDNGSEIVVGGLDKPTKIMSTEYDIIYGQEYTEATETDHESLTTRLRNGVMPFQQFIGDCNPDGPRHWIKQREKAGALKILESRHEDNPRLFDQRTGEVTGEGRRYLKKLDQLTGVRYFRLRKGLWIGAEGIVYGDFDPAVHVIAPFPIPRHWRRFRCIDFGYTNPFVCQWWAMDHDGRLYLYREIYFSGRTVADHARQIVALTGDERIEDTVCDHDAEDRATLDQEGIPNSPAHKAVKPGIEAVQLRLRRAGDNRPRLFLFEGCTVEVDDTLTEAKKPARTQDEFDGYIWLPPTAGRAPREEPRKKDDHGMDTTRYAVAFADELGDAAPAEWTGASFTNW